MDLTAAFDRLENFRALQLAQHGDYTPEAVACLQEAAEVGDAERALINERIEQFGSGSAGAVLLGVLLGVFASEA